MAWQWTAFTLPLTLAFFLLGLLALYLARQWRSEDAAPGTGLATGVLACLAVTLGFYVLDVSATSLEISVVFNQLQYLGLAPLTPFMLAYVLVYVGREELLTARAFALLFAPALGTVLVVSTNDLHGWFWSAQVIDPDTGQLVNELGPAYLGFFVYTYAYGVTSVVLLVREAVDAHGVYLRQIVGMIVGIAAPLVGGVVYVLDVVPPHYPTPTYAAFLVTAAAFGWPVLRYDLFSVVPIAHRTLLARLDEGVLACDEDGVVVTANEGAATLLGTQRSAMVGSSLDDALGPLDGEIDLDETLEREGPTVVTATAGDRVVDVSSTPLAQAGHRVGRLVVLRDVTERHDRERQLSRQNAYLDEFAEVVSHDIATPLAVIENRTRLLEMTGDLEHVEDIYGSTERIHRLMDELLELARQGKRIDEVEAVAFEAVVQDAWNAVRTGDVELSVTSSTQLQASRSRLRQLLENCFQNSVTHGTPTDVTFDEGDVREPGKSGPRAGRGSHPPGSSLPTDGEDRSGVEKQVLPAPPAPDGDEGAVDGATVPAGTADGTSAGTPDATVSPLTVTVGTFPGGFFVEDDGVGIPESDRSQVFEQGYSSTAEGTGLGLAIVRRIVDAHGWAIRVTESEGGGARFEVTGVDAADER